MSRRYWAAVVAAALVTGSGVLVAALGLARSSGPDAVVTGYFAALGRGDAPGALAYGEVPAGPHVLLTSEVLAVQRRTAPITDVHVRSVHRAGRTATVAVDYAIAFPGAPQQVHDTVALHERGDTWRMDAVAVSTQFQLLGAVLRAQIAGAGIPKGTVLAFPGAVPVGFDTPYLQLTAADDYLTLSGAVPITQVFVGLTDAGRRAVVASVARSLDACYGPHASAAALCPLPDGQYVPGRLRGSVVGPLDRRLGIDVARDPEGTIEVDGTVPVRGSYVRISFDGRVQSGSGTVQVPVSGRAYPVAPLAIHWRRTP